MTIPEILARLPEVWLIEYRLGGDREWHVNALRGITIQKHDTELEVARLNELHNGTKYRVAKYSPHEQFPAMLEQARREAQPCVHAEGEEAHRSVVAMIESAVAQVRRETLEEVIAYIRNFRWTINKEDELLKGIRKLAEQPVKGGDA